MSAILPIQYIESLFNGHKALNSRNDFKLARIARLPRLYRLIRILRLTKLLKVARKRQEFESIIEQNITSFQTTRLIKTVWISWYLNHLMACFWFFSTTFEDDVWVTWLGNKDLVDSSPPYQYLNAFYWAFQTTTTVGYGDFSISTYNEYVIAIIWMLFGTNAFTFVVSTVSSIISDLERESTSLHSKISALRKYADNHKLPKKT